SGIKGAPVDLSTGQLAEDRFKIATPQPSEPDAVAAVVADIVGHFSWDGPIGITLPCVLKSGTALTAANVDARWKGIDAKRLFAERLGRRPEDVVVLNDADAAGLAEINHGAGASVQGVVVLLTFGTGIGSALFLDGKLVPNTEFGHLEVDGHDAEKHAAASAKEHHGWSYEKWAHHVSTYLRTLEDLIWPDLIIAGGGVSRKAEKWLPLLETRTTVVPASLQNNAGIVGAANAAARGLAR
ncbi:MAG: polyphosphate--glucose phosphotransferase, partial [Sciscionella sp.]